MKYERDDSLGFFAGIFFCFGFYAIVCAIGFFLIKDAPKKRVFNYQFQNVKAAFLEESP